MRKTQWYNVLVELIGDLILNHCSTMMYGPGREDVYNNIYVDLPSDEWLSYYYRQS